MQRSTGFVFDLGKIWTSADCLWQIKYSTNIYLHGPNNANHDTCWSLLLRIYDKSTILTLVQISQTTTTRYFYSFYNFLCCSDGSVVFFPLIAKCCIILFSAGFPLNIFCWICCQLSSLCALTSVIIMILTVSSTLDFNELSFNRFCWFAWNEFSGG